MLSIILEPKQCNTQGHFPEFNGLGLPIEKLHRSQRCIAEQRRHALLIITNKQPVDVSSDELRLRVRPCDDPRLPPGLPAVDRFQIRQAVGLNTFEIGGHTA